MFEFNYLLTEEDCVEYNVYRNINSASQRKTLKTTKALLGILYLLLFLLVSLMSKSKTIIIFIGAIIVIFYVIVLLLYDKIFKKNLRSKLTSMIKEGRPPYGFHQRLVFNEDSFICLTEFSEAKYQYCAVERVAVNDESVYLMFNSTRAVIIPCHAFKTDDERASFLAFINSKLNS